MSSSPSLFSRARPGKMTERKVRGFMGLPGEVRNMIYEYYFQDVVRCEVASKGRKFESVELHTVRLWSGLIHSEDKVFKYESKLVNEQPITIRISRPLGRYNIVRGLQTNWLASVHSLNLVCKQVYTETVVFLYRDTVFVFNAPKRIDNFLEITTKPNLANLTRLELHYDTYGDPKATQDRIWQDKHHESWLRACNTASKKLVSLQKLEVWIQSHHCAPRFNLREPWIAPLLQFRRLARVHQSADTAESYRSRSVILESVQVHIRTRWSKSPLVAFNGNRELARACTDLHLLFGEAVSHAVQGATAEQAMADFNAAWTCKYNPWRHHLQFASTGW